MAKQITKNLKFKAYCSLQFPGETDFMLDVLVLGADKQPVQGIKPSFPKKVTIENGKEKEFTLTLTIDESVPSGIYAIHYTLTPLDDDGQRVDDYANITESPFQYANEVAAADYEKVILKSKNLGKIHSFDNIRNKPADYIKNLFENPAKLGIPKDFEEIFKAVTAAFNSLDASMQQKRNPQTGHTMADHYRVANECYNYSITGYKQRIKTLAEEMKIANQFSLTLEGDNIKFQPQVLDDPEKSQKILKLVWEFANYLLEFLTRSYYILQFAKPGSVGLTEQPERQRPGGPLQQRQRGT